MEVFFHIEGDVDSRYCKEKPSLILLHNLDQGPVAFDEPQNDLKGQDPSSPKIGLRILTLESQLHPLLPRFLRRLLKILRVKTVDQIPSLLLLERNVRFQFEMVKSLQFLLSKRVVLATKSLLTISSVFGVSLRLGWEKTGLSFHQYCL